LLTLVRQPKSADFNPTTLYVLYTPEPKVCYSKSIMIQRSPYNTLLITPDETWAQLLYEHLVQNGFAQLAVAPTGDSALALLQQIIPRLVLIDLGLPDCNVVALCAALLLAQPTAKVILITENGTEAPSATLSTQIAGCIGRTLPLEAWPALLTHILQGGMAFSQNMVKAALVEARAVYKRPPPLIIGALQVDLTQRVVLYAGQRLLLTPREFALLAYLAGNADLAITVDELLDKAWGYDSDNGTPAQVRLYITRLRRKLLATAQTSNLIRTVRGVGYCLNSAAMR
jgi:DNA-binding response OmpR family regulator